MTEIPVAVPITNGGRFARSGYTVASIVAVGVLVSAAAAGPVVKGDRAAWGDVVAAYRMLHALSGWRERMTGSGGGITIREVVPPKASRSVTQTASGTVETVTVGPDVRYRMTYPGAHAGWICLTLPQDSLPDPTTTGGVVEARRGVATTIDGTPVRTYSYVWTPPAQTRAQVETATVTIYVAAQSGLPRRFVASFPGGSQTIDYYDYGARIEITLPPCG